MHMPARRVPTSLAGKDTQGTFIFNYFVKPQPTFITNYHPSSTPSFNGMIQ